MAINKTERLLNLLIMMLATRYYVDRDAIRQAHYPGMSDVAFDKAFERDKEELRSLGIPIVTEQMEPGMNDKPGYRIRPEDYALEPIQFTHAEASLIGVATKVWENATMSAATTNALSKLKAAGTPISTEDLDLGQARLAAVESSFDDLVRAVLNRHAITFSYRRGTSTAHEKRRFHPWGVVRFSGRWYTVGWDLERGAERVFRLDRIQGSIAFFGKSEAYEIPDDIDINETARRLAQPPQPLEVAVLVRPGVGMNLREIASSVESGVTGPDGQSWDRVQITGDAARLVDEVLRVGSNAYLEEPADLKATLVKRLRGIVKAHTGTPETEVGR